MRWVVLLLVLGSCCRLPYYAVKEPPPSSSYLLTVFVAAKHLDYTNFYTLCRSMQRSKSGMVGHAWIHLHGLKNGRWIDLVGGLSGELDLIKPAYCNGVMDYVDAGDPNPVRYLWSSLDDGFFQEGSGGHQPTYAVQFALTREQFETIYLFIKTFHYRDYSLTGSQCASFAAQAAALAGHELSCHVTVDIKRRMYFRGRKMTLWNDPQYRQITFPSPDILERSLKEAVERGEGRRV